MVFVYFFLEKGRLYKIKGYNNRLYFKNLFVYIYIYFDWKIELIVVHILK